MTGRSLNECRQQFEALWQVHQAQPSYRSPETWQNPIPPNAFPAVNPGPSHAEPHPIAHDAFGSRKRPFYPPEKPPIFPRAIQPRPPLTGGPFPGESGSPVPTSPNWPEGVGGRSTEPPKKRGRPSKAESERRKAEAEARGEIYPAPRRRASTTKLPTTPSGAASATSDGSMVSPMQTAHTPEVHNQERLLEPAPNKDIVSIQAARTGSLGSEAPDMDPVRGIIRSQANQDRRLPLPLEFNAQPPRRESLNVHDRPLEHPYHGFPTPRPEQNSTSATPTRQIVQHPEGVPSIPSTSGGYLPAMSQPAGTTT